MRVINLKNLGVITINTSLTKEAILKLAKHAPEALVIKDEEGSEVFKIGFGEKAEISKYGIMFNKADLEEGTAFIKLDETLENNEIAEKYATVLLNLKNVEETALEVYSALEEMLLDVAESIEQPTLTSTEAIEEVE